MSMSQLDALRACVHAVHGGTSDHAARASAQQQLVAFEARQNAWRECMGYIREARDPVVVAFLLGVIESAQVTSAGTGSGMAVGDRAVLRGFVLEFAVAAHRANFARFLLTKCAKILVDAAKIDWPSQYPDFFDQVLGLCQDKALRPLGLQVLLTTFEEWLATSVRRGRDVPLSSARRNALRDGIANVLPRAMPALTLMLRNEVERQTTVPSSKNKQIVLEILHLLFSSSVPIQDHLADGTLMNLLFQIMSCPSDQLQSQNDDRARVVHCLAQMVGRNCIPRDAEGFVMQVSTQMLVLLRALTERGGVQSVPEDFLLQLVRFLAIFLERHLSRVEAQPQFPMNDMLTLLFRFSFLLPVPALFLEALSVWTVFVDFVLANKPSAERQGAYISGLMQLSGKLIERMLFSQSADFLACLSSTPTGGGSGGATQAIGHHGGRSNSSSGIGVDLSEDGADEDEAQQMWSVPQPARTELDDYLAKAFELITSLVALPAVVEQLLSSVAPVLLSRVQAFHQHQQSQSASSSADNLASRDLTTLCGFIAAAAGNYVVPATFANKLEQASNIYQNILDNIALPIVQHRTWGRGHFIIELLLQCYRTLESFASWLGLCLRPGSPARCVSLACSLLDRTALLIALSLDSSISPTPEIIMVSAVQLSRSLLIIAKPSSDRAGRLYQELLSGSGRGSLPQPVRERIAACMAEVVLSGIAVPSSSLDSKSNAIRAQFVQAVGGDVQDIVNAVRLSSNLQTHQNKQGHKPIVSNSAMQNKVRGAAGNLAAVSWSRRNAPRGQKQLVFQTIRPALEATGQLLHLCLAPVPQRAQPHSLQTSIGGIRTAKQLMVFLRFATDSLRSDIGVDTLCQIVIALCDVVKQYILGGLSARTVSPSATLLSLLVSVLRLFSVAVNDPSSKFRRVMPHVLNAIAEFDVALFDPMSQVRAVCLSTVAGKKGLDDVLTVRFRLFRICMLQHWSYFMGNQKMNKLPDQLGKNFFESSMKEIVNIFNRAAKGGVVKSGTEKTGGAAKVGAPAGGVEAVAIAPERIRYIIRTLEELHRIHRLFYKCRGDITGECLTSCLRLLASTGMELLQTEILSLIHKIASSDFKAFFESFLPSFASRIAGQTGAMSAKHQQLLSQFSADSTDAASFGENCLVFVNMLHI